MVFFQQASRIVTRQAGTNRQTCHDQPFVASQGSGKQQSRRNSSRHYSLHRLLPYSSQNQLIVHDRQSRSPRCQVSSLCRWCLVGEGPPKRAKFHSNTLWRYPLEACPLFESSGLNRRLGKSQGWGITLSGSKTRSSSPLWSYALCMRVHRARF